MSGDGSLVYWSHEIIHYSYHHFNDDGIYDDESLEVSVCDGRCEHRSLETSHHSSRNSLVSHSSDDGRGGYRAQRPSTFSLVIVDFIILVLMLEVKLGIKRPATLPITIFNQGLVLMGYVAIGLRSATLPPITQVSVVDC